MTKSPFSFSCLWDQKLIFLYFVGDQRAMSLHLTGEGVGGRPNVLFPIIFGRPKFPFPLNLLQYNTATLMVEDKFSLTIVLKCMSIIHITEGSTLNV